MDTVHQDHESEMLINLEQCKPYQHCANTFLICFFFFPFISLQLDKLKAAVTYMFPNAEGNHVDVGQLNLALFKVP